MPLLFNDNQLTIPTSLDQFFIEHKHYQDPSKNLIDQPPTPVGPEKLLYVSQREVAGTTPEDGAIQYLGSDDATTCHIVILRDSGCGSVVLSHFDGCGSANGVKVLMRLISELSQGKPSGKLELHVAGGFRDDRQLSSKLSLEILNAFNAVQENVHLVTACITDLNNTVKNGVNFPVIYGMAVDVKTGAIFKATFPDKGPDLDFRCARNFTGGHELIIIYDHKTNLMTIGPFLYQPLDSIDAWLRLPDGFLLQHLSTSPEQEPPGYVQHVRDTLTVMKTHPNPMETVFKGNNGRVYKKEQNGSWTMIK